MKPTRRVCEEYEMEKHRGLHDPEPHVELPTVLVVAHYWHVSSRGWQVVEASGAAEADQLEGAIHREAASKACFSVATRQIPVGYRSVLDSDNARAMCFVWGGLIGVVCGFLLGKLF